MTTEKNVPTARREFLRTALTGAAYVAPMVASMSMETLHAKPSGGCPPGLEKKDPPCVPPGQTKK
jgi:hypothetical protein